MLGAGVPRLLGDAVPRLLGAVTRYRYSSIARCCCSSIARRSCYDWKADSWERYSALGAAVLRSLCVAVPRLLGAVVP